MRAHLFSDGHNKTLALDRVAVRILVEREGSLLLDLLHLEDEFFQLHPAQGRFFWWCEHSRERELAAKKRARNPPRKSSSFDSYSNRYYKASVRDRKSV